MGTKVKIRIFRKESRYWRTKVSQPSRGAFEWCSLGYPRPLFWDWPRAGSIASSSMWTSFSCRPVNLNLNSIGHKATCRGSEIYRLRHLFSDHGFVVVVLVPSAVHDMVRLPFVADDVQAPFVNEVYLPRGLETRLFVVADCPLHPLRVVQTVTSTVIYSFTRFSWSSIVFPAPHWRQA